MNRSYPSDRVHERRVLSRLKIWGNLNQPLKRTERVSLRARLANLFVPRNDLMEFSTTGSNTRFTWIDPR